MNRLVRGAASVGGLGYLPAGGTMGSAVGFALAWVFNSSLLYWFAGTCVVGFLLCRPAREAFGSVDPHPFILDEVAGMLLAVWGHEKRLPVYIAAFFLFRILDVVKPWPISIFQRNKSPLDIMSDDLAAGAFVNLILQVLVKTTEWL
ncbi:MAG: phosphatidylglycerophosphatase A family protein [Candidatus Omnitrophota bacterium]